MWRYVAMWLCGYVAVWPHQRRHQEDTKGYYVYTTGHYFDSKGQYVDTQGHYVDTQDAILTLKGIRRHETLKKTLNNLKKKLPWLPT